MARSIARPRAGTAVRLRQYGAHSDKTQIPYCVVGIPTALRRNWAKTDRVASSR